MLLRHQVDPEQIAGVLIEPMLGEGGIVIPSAAFWDRLTALCERYGWVLIADEVQTGIGRCGQMFAVERWDLEPELILLAKGFAGGVMPIGGTLGSERVMAHATNHVGATFGWTPAACVAALENIEAILRDDVLANVREMERVALEVLGPLVDRHEQVGDVRAAGGLIGVEFVTDMETIAPAPNFQLAVHHAALRRGVLGITQPGKWVYRLQPALNQPIDLFRWSCEQLAEAIDEVSRRPAGRVGCGVEARTGTGSSATPTGSPPARASGSSSWSRPPPSRRRGWSRSRRVRRSRPRSSALEPVGPREVALGSYVRVPHHPALRPADGLAVSVCVWIAPGAAGGRRRALISTWGGATDGRWRSTPTAGRGSRSAPGASSRRSPARSRSSPAPGLGSRPSSIRARRRSRSPTRGGRRRRLAVVEVRSRPCALPAPGPAAGRAADRGRAASGGRRRPPRRQARRAAGRAPGRGASSRSRAGRWARAAAGGWSTRGR